MTLLVQQENSAATQFGKVMYIVAALRRSSKCKSATADSDVMGGSGGGAIVRGYAMNSPVFVAALAASPRESLRQR